MLALPNGQTHLTHSDRDRAKAAIGSSSDAELQLMALQASNNMREDVLYEMFESLGISERPKLETVDWRALAL